LFDANATPLSSQGIECPREVTESHFVTERIFISYRRDDSFDPATTICTEFQRLIGAEQIFMDKSLQPGVDWPDEIRDALENAHTVLVVVKDWDKWLGVLEYGVRRIDDPNDWIRQEVALSLSQNKKVIPVLIGPNTKMIPSKLLPEKLNKLPEKQQVCLNRDTWDRDLKFLIETACPELTNSIVQPPAVRSFSVADIAQRCEAALQAFNEKSVAEWAEVQPKRFVEPHIAMREDFLDRSDKREAEPATRSNQSLLSDQEKLQPGHETAVEQYRRLFAKRKKSHLGARICLTEDSGAGKSIFTRHLRMVFSTLAGQATLFGGKPGLVVRWEGREKNWPFDLRQTLEKEVHDTAVAHGITGQQVADYAIAQHRVCLILDALDQVTHDFTPKGDRIDRSELLDRIFRFLNSEQGQHCHVVVTGRSYAITGDGEDGWRFPADTWAFATLEGFDPQQQTRYLSDFLVNRKLQDFIPSYQDVAELLEVPVILSLVADIAEADPRPRAQVKLDQFKSRGDVYREAHAKLAERAAKSPGIKANLNARSRWEVILSAAAFAMMCDERQRRSYTVSGEHGVLNLRAAASRWARGLNGTSFEIADKDWEELATFSQLTNHATLERSSDSALGWKHRGWMEYFAGLYLARYAPPEAADVVADFTNDPDWYWVWRFAIEMPEHVADKTVRTRSLSLLFQRPQSGRRPNELIYRSWKVLKATSAGRDVLNMFQNEYRELLTGNNPIARQLEDSFRPCPPNPGPDSLTFLMGSPATDKNASDDEKPPVEMSVKPFFMANAPVTKEQYWLYDPAHEHDSAFAENLAKYSPDRNCPVIFVAWYDAWCFAVWCKARLPCEVEWEFACRAGTATKYWWGDKMDRSKCKSLPGATTPASPQHANLWGLMEMSGNVFEWCDTWNSRQISESPSEEYVGGNRVLRGGLFRNLNPRALRSASRFSSTPDNLGRSVGFRISRTP